MPMHWIKRKPVHMQNINSSTATVIELTLLREEDEGSHVYLYLVPHVIFSSVFSHALTFLHVPHPDVLGRQIEIESESENNFLMYGYNVGQYYRIV